FPSELSIPDQQDLWPTRSSGYAGNVLVARQGPDLGSRRPGPWPSQPRNLASRFSVSRVRPQPLASAPSSAMRDRAASALLDPRELAPVPGGGMGAHRP